MKKTHTLISLIFIGLFLFSCSSDDDLEIDTIDDFNQFLTDEFNDQAIPALSVVVFNKSTILHEAYLGKSNVDQDIALQPDHLFLLASISKTITATALLQLYDRDSFDLDDKINNYLPFQVNVPGTSTDITFKMLLTHTSGIADGSALDNQYYDNMDSPVALDFFLRNYLEPGGQFYNASENYYDFEPGTESEYSNVGNALIGLLVAEISGIDFNTFCKQNIFIPLGMKNTFWRLSEINQTIVQPYDYINGRNQALAHYTFTDYPNGGLRSTGKDFSYFLAALTQNGSLNNFQLLKPTTVEMMRTRQIPNLDNEMGLHLFVMNGENGLWGHDGGEKGVTTTMAFNPTTGVGAIVLSNLGDAELEEILVEAYKFGLKL